MLTLIATYIVGPALGVVIRGTYYLIVTMLMQAPALIQRLT